MKGLIAIPAYNEEPNLGDVLARVREASGPEDVLVVDDGSTDQTGAVARAAGAQLETHPENRGYAAALATAMRIALERGYDYLVLFDADGQHDPRYVASLRARASSPDFASGPDIVIGSRFVEHSGYRAPLGRKIGMTVFSYLTVLGGRRIYDTTSGFKLIKRRALELLAGQPFNDFHAEMIVFALVAGLRVEEEPIHVAERESGTSMYSWFDALAYPARTLGAIARLYPVARRLRRRSD